MKQPFSLVLLILCCVDTTAQRPWICANYPILHNEYYESEKLYHRYVVSDLVICPVNNKKGFAVEDVFNIMISNISYTAPTSNQGKVVSCSKVELSANEAIANMLKAAPQYISMSSDWIKEFSNSPIVTVINSSEHSVTNYTLEGHPLHDGKVTRTVIAKDGNIRVTTVGVGNNKTRTGWMTNSCDFCMKLLWTTVDERLRNRVQFLLEQQNSTLPSASNSFSMAGTVASNVRYISPSTEYPFRHLPEISQFHSDESLVSWQEGHGESKRFGFIDKDKIVRIPFSFIRAHDFHEGLAAVKKGKSFAESKWGFINAAGETVIPFIMEKEPGDFHSGRAFIQISEGKNPGIRSKFGYIDKAGKIVDALTQSSNSNCFYSAVNPTMLWEWMNFNQGYVATAGIDNCVDYLTLLDVDGNKFSLSNAKGEFVYLNHHFKGLTAYHSDTYMFVPELIWETIPIKENSILFEWIWQNPLNLINGSYNKKLGLISPTGNMILPPIFTKLSYFDNVTNLAYAIFENADGSKLEGYVDKLGIFQILKK